MKTSVKTLLQKRQGLEKFLNTDLKGVTGFKFRKINRQLTEIFQDYDQSILSLLRAYGKENGNGQFTVEKENIEEFNKEYEKLLDEEIELDFNPIKIKELSEKDLESLELSSKDWDSIDTILIEE